MPIYATNKQKIKNMYVNVDGKKRKIISGWINEDNELKKVYSLSDTYQSDTYQIAPIDAHNSWNYTLDDINNTITLNYYTGSETDVIVYANYVIGDKTYKTQIANMGDNGTTFDKYMFSYKTAIETITFSKNIDTSNVSNMGYMFRYCIILTSIDFGTNFNTGNMTNMECTFQGCQLLKDPDLSNWNTSKVTSMSNMFGECYGLTSLDLSKWDTSNVINMQSMFSGCRTLTSLDLRGWDTSNVKYMSQMFNTCKALKTIYVTAGKWSTSQANTNNMFNNCGVSSVTYK